MVKTIYDPCPVGFKIPEGDAFTGFSQENSTWNSDFAEKHFYTDASKTKIIVFKAAGVFEVNPVKLINVNNIGYYRTPDFYDTSNPYFLWFGSYKIITQNYTSRYYGNSIRPVRE